MSGTSRDSDWDRRLEDALAEYMRAEERGERPDRRAFLARYPDLALFSATLSVMVACLLRVECGTWPCPTPSMTRINPSPSRALSGMGVRGTRSVGKPARPFPVPTACGRVQR